jgi:hypothetical protein
MREKEYIALAGELLESLLSEKIWRREDRRRKKGKY